jgi:hypothetical protein
MWHHGTSSRVEVRMDVSEKIGDASTRHLSVPHRVCGKLFPSMLTTQSNWTTVGHATTPRPITSPEIT